MAGSPKKRARLAAAALLQAAVDNPELQDRADLAAAASHYLGTGPGDMPPSTMVNTAADPVARGMHKIYRKLTVEYVQDRALLDWVEHRDLLLRIIDGEETSSKDAIDKHGVVHTLVSYPSITERLRGLELLARYSTLGRKADTAALEKPEQALADLLGLSVEDIKALVGDNTPAWSIADAPPAFSTPEDA